MNTKSKKRNAQQRAEKKRADRRIESRRKHDTRIQRRKTEMGVVRKVYRQLQEQMKIQMEARAKEAAEKEKKALDEGATPAKTVEIEAVSTHEESVDAADALLQKKSKKKT